jgi:hypothetical protein
VSFFANNWLPTLFGAAIFVAFGIGVLTVLSALASKIEERFVLPDDQDIDLGLAA